MMKTSGDVYLHSLIAAKAAMRLRGSFSTDIRTNCNNGIMKDRKISSGLSAWQQTSSCSGTASIWTLCSINSGPRDSWSVTKMLLGSRRLEMNTSTCLAATPFPFRKWLFVASSDP